ncbi:hypothetical protein ACIOGZ_28815 [Kitasatospora sp. NPDC088160]|uniref:hypothetical protein n=1 Tax=Kitasatospora sp. NPDC088160 TaxID=3364072 RepID=UPI00381FBEEA
MESRTTGAQPENRPDCRISGREARRSKVSGRTSGFVIANRISGALVGGLPGRL